MCKLFLRKETKDVLISFLIAEIVGVTKKPLSQSDSDRTLSSQTSN